MAPAESNRRKDDMYLFVFLRRTAYVLASLSVIGAFLYWLGGTKFVTKEETEKIYLDFRAKDQEAHDDILGLKSDVKYTRESVDEIKQLLKERRK